LSASAGVNLSPATGTITINPTTAGTIANMAISGSTGSFSTLTASAVTTITGGTAVTLGTAASGILQVTGGTSIGGGLNVSGITWHGSNVGIGTTNPLEALQAAGAIRSTSNASNFSGAVGALFDYYSGSMRFAVYNGTTVGQMSLASNGTLTTTALSSSSANIAGYNVRTSSTIDMSGLSTSTFYPLVIPVDVSRTATRCRIQVDLNSNKPTWATHPSGFSINVDWSVNGSGWGTVGVTRVIHNYVEAWNSSLICGGITQFIQSSSEVIYLRGGGVYYFESDGSTNVAPTVYTTSTVINSQTIAPISSALNNPLASGSGSVGVGSQYMVGSLYNSAGRPMLNPTGGILQVVTTTLSSTTTLVANGTPTAVSGLSATITPYSTSSTIWVVAHITYGSTGTTYGGWFRRSGTDIGLGNSGGNMQRVSIGMALTSDANQVNSFAYSYVDSPASTSALTYQFYVNNDNTNTLYVNRSVNDSNSVTGKRGISTVTLVEIAG
jgi:hypothetical protein